VFADKELLTMKERPMATVEKMPMLIEGQKMLNDHLRLLKAERPLIIDSIEEARAHGDLSENAEYHAAKERQGQVEATIADIEDKLSRAVVIDPKTLSGDKIVFGATVTLLDENEKPVRYQIVGQTEADAKSGRISYNSPLGRALIGRKADEEVEVTVPAGDKFYLVSKIEFI
jgi:transcription elongation factor GreA